VNVPRQRRLPHLEPPLPQRSLQAFLVGDRPLSQRFQNSSLSQRFIHHEYLFIMMNKYSLILQPTSALSSKKPVQLIFGNRPGRLLYWEGRAAPPPDANAGSQTAIAGRLGPNPC
jgi:hypothetical protein